MKLCILNTPKHTVDMIKRHIHYQRREVLKWDNHWGIKRMQNLSCKDRKAIYKLCRRLNYRKSSISLGKLSRFHYCWNIHLHMKSSMKILQNQTQVHSNNSYIYNWKYRMQRIDKLCKYCYHRGKVAHHLTKDMNCGISYSKDRKRERTECTHLSMYRSSSFQGSSNISLKSEWRKLELQ